MAPTADLLAHALQLTEAAYAMHDSVSLALSARERVSSMALKAEEAERAIAIFENAAKADGILTPQMQASPQADLTAWLMPLSFWPMVCAQVYV